MKKLGDISWLTVETQKHLPLHLKWMQSSLKKIFINYKLKFSSTSHDSFLEGIGTQLMLMAGSQQSLC